MLKVALTGGMACGKSVVGEMFARLGAHVIHADKIAHDLMRPGRRVYEEIVAHFGRGILAEDGSIDRAKLAQAAFQGGVEPAEAGVAPGLRPGEDGSQTRPHTSAGATDRSQSRPHTNQQPSRIAELNAIVHPAVIAYQDAWLSDIARREPAAVGIVEAALIFEAGVESHFDKVVVVTCDAEQKVERFARRANLALDAARAEVERRTAAQIPDDEKASRADYVIRNSGALEDTASQVETVFSEMKREALARAGMQ